MSRRSPSTNFRSGRGGATLHGLHGGLRMAVRLPIGSRKGGVVKPTMALSLADLLVNEVDAQQAVLVTHLSGLSLLPRGRLDPADVASYEAELSNGGTLDRALSQAEADAEFVVIDPPSGLGRVTSAALATSDFVLLAFQTASPSLRSIGTAPKVAA